MMLIFPAALYVHIARIPLAAECGYGIYAPVNENAEFGVYVPFRNAVLLQGIPRILVFSVFDDIVNFL